MERRWRMWWFLLKGLLLLWRVLLGISVGAAEWFFTNMNSFMLFQISKQCKLLVTMWTAVCKHSLPFVTCCNWEVMQLVLHKISQSFKGLIGQPILFCCILKLESSLLSSFHNVFFSLVGYSSGFGCWNFALTNISHLKELHLSGCSCTRMKEEINAHPTLPQ